MIKTHTDIQVQGSLSGERIGLSFDENSLAHIMGLLTDLYSDPEQAVIREYTTNAYDAHQEAGVSLPIEVSLPTPLSPYFKVKDYGTGLSVAQIHTIYSKYGASTKRETNDQVGMLGLGCKSALTYTNQFTLVAVQNGTRVTVVVSRDEDGAGSMTVVDTTATDEPNGVEIVVPTKASNQFARKAREFFSYWRPGTVLVDGAEPEPLKGLKLTDDLYVVKDPEAYGQPNAVVVMGNVPYPVTGSALKPGLGYGHKLVAYVSIGSLNFTPSREQLHYTNLTNATLSEISDEFRAAVVPSVSRVIQEAPTHHEALDRYWQAYAAIPRVPPPFHFTYRGTRLPDKVGPRTVLVPHASGRLNACSTYDGLSGQGLDSVFWFYGYDRESFTPAQKKKLLAWAQAQDVQPRSFALVGSRPTEPWINPDRVFAWSEVASIKLARRAPVLGQAPSSRIPGSYDVFTPEHGIMEGLPADEIDVSYPVFYTLDRFTVPATQILKLGYDKYSLVILTSNRVDKFKRNFPGCEIVDEPIKRVKEAWVHDRSEDERLAVALTACMTGDYNALKLLDPERVDDPDLKRSIRLVRQDVSELRKQACTLGINLRDLGVDYEDPLKRYPLFDRWTFRAHEHHTYLYMNAVYGENGA